MSTSTQGAGGLQRHDRNYPCEVCGSDQAQPRGHGTRCSGYTTEASIYCSREEFALGLEREPDGTYRHVIGACRCGTRHAVGQMPEAAPLAKRLGSHSEQQGKLQRQLVTSYQYADEKGQALFYVDRYEPKDFRQRAPDGTPTVAGIRKVPYRLPELLDADPNTPVYIVEGEKDVETARNHGLVATCNPGGACKWNIVAETAQLALRDRDVVVIADADTPGRKHAEQVESSLRGVARSVRRVELPNKDVSEFFAAGGTVARLEAIVRRSPHSAPTIADLCISAEPEWFKVPLPPRRWLLRDSRTPESNGGVLPLGKCGNLIAAGGVGKTMSLVQLALAVATGTSWLDTFTVESAGRVLMLLGEEDADEVRRRMYYAGQDAIRQPDPDSIVIMPLSGRECAFLRRGEHGRSEETEFWSAVRGIVEDEGPFKLIIIDPISRFGGPDVETENAWATRFVEVCEELASISGATVLVAHHTNKFSRTDGARVGGAAGRGSSALFDGFRWQASLAGVSLESPSEDIINRGLSYIVTLENTKSNYSILAQPVILRRSRGGCLHALDEQEQWLVAPLLDKKVARRQQSAELRAER